MEVDCQNAPCCPVPRTRRRRARRDQGAAKQRERSAGHRPKLTKTVCFVKMVRGAMGTPNAPPHSALRVGGGSKRAPCSFPLPLVSAAWGEWGGSGWGRTAGWCDQMPSRSFRAMRRTARHKLANMKPKMTMAQMIDRLIHIFQTMPLVHPNISEANNGIIGTTERKKYLASTRSDLKYPASRPPTVFRFVICHSAIPCWLLQRLKSLFSALNATRVG